MKTPLRVLALLEATTITGPAKNMFEFISQARQPSELFPGGVEVCIVTFLRGGKSNAFLEGAKAAGIAIEAIKEQRAFQLSIATDLKRIVAERNPDIIETHNIKSHFLARLLGLDKGRRWIAFHHGYISSDLKVRAYNQLDRWSLRHADALVAVCGPFGDQLAAAGLRRDRISIRHNMIKPYVRPPATDVQRLRETWKLTPEEHVVFSAGRLSREKGHLDLVNAIALLRDTSGASSFRVILGGEGPDRALIEKRCTELNLSDTVTLIGHQADLRAWYALADVMVLPSHSEGSPNVLLEALAAGVPTVATAVGGVPEIVTDNVNALLVPRGDCQKMADAIGMLLNDAALRERLSTAGLAVTERFTPQAYRDAILALYRKTLEAA